METMKNNTFTCYSKIAIILIVLSFISEATASTEVRFIREGATGNNSGTDWTNTWTSLPLTLVRGDTYYIADGNYPN